MKIPESAVQEILDSVDIVDIIGESVQLKKAGNSFKGLCPFHGEKTPSFNVNPEKNLFYCFGCGVGGNAITFVSRFHNLSFVDAVMFLAERYSINIEQSKDDPRRSGIISLHDEVLLETRRRLLAPEGKEAREYMKGRNFTDETVETFGLGYFPMKTDVTAYHKKYGKDVMLASGLFMEGQYGMRMRFFNRLSFPIKSITGKVVGFSGRSLDGSNPKYMNSPETETFKKREILYNFDRAKDLVKKTETCIITEGYFDVMRLHENGYGNSAATMGTSLTKEHVNMLKRYAQEVILLFDGDDAGFKAALKALDVFMESNFFPYAVFLPKGEDPDTFLLKKGKKEFERLLSAKKDLFIYTVDLLRSRAGDFNRKVMYLGRIKEKLLKINDPYRRDHYMEAAASKFEIDPDTMKKDVDLSLAKTTLKKANSNNLSYICERSFLSSLFQIPEDLGMRLTEGISESNFHDPAAKKIFKKVVDVFSAGGTIEVLVNDPEVGEEIAEMRIQQESQDDYYRSAMENRSKIIRNAMPSLRKSITRKISEASSPDSQNRASEEQLELLRIQNNLVRNEITDKKSEV
jgi:DNA primase